MLARLLAMALCLSPDGVLSKRMDGLSLFVARRLLFTLPIRYCVLRKFWYIHNKGTCLWNFVLNCGLETFRKGISIVNLAQERSQLKSHSEINWTVVGQPSWQHFRRSTASLSQLLVVKQQYDSAARLH